MSPTTFVTAKSHGLKCVRNRCFTISLPPFLSGTRTDRRALARLSSLSWSKTFQVPGQVRERTGPALIHNQLVDRSLQTNVCDETACYECQELLPVLIRFLSLCPVPASVQDSCGKNLPQGASLAGCNRSCLA